MPRSAGGTTVIVGMPAMDAEVSLPLFSWFHAEKRVVGLQLRVGPGAAGVPPARLVHGVGRARHGSAITKVRPLDEVNAALDDLRAGAVVRTVLRP